MSEAYENEDRILINSVKMQSYADKPEMSVREITEATIKGINSEKYDVIIVNFANPDMVGHSGNKEATRKAIQIVDEEVKKVVDAVLGKNGVVLLTADHGNADMMEYEDGSPCSSHTTALVPFFLIGNDLKSMTLEKKGSLADIAPTILNLLNEKIPNVMTGKTLIKRG